MTSGVYVLELSSGAVKVGGSADIDKRVTQHRNNASVYGAEVVRTVAFEAEEWRVAESACHEAVREFGARQVDTGARETYRGISFDQAAQIVERHVGNAHVPHSNDQHYHMLLRILHSAYNIVHGAGLGDHMKVVYEASPELWFAEYGLNGDVEYLAASCAPGEDTFVWETNFVADEPVLRRVVSLYGLYPEILPDVHWYSEATVTWRLRFLTPQEYPGLYLPGAGFSVPGRDPFGLNVSLTA